MRPILLLSAPLLALALAACQPSAPDTEALNRVEAEQRQASAEGGMVSCAKRAGTALARECVVERSETAEGQVLTVRHPDGGFRRFLITKDGRGVIAADGAQAATVKILGPDRIEVAIAGERYELPATIKGAPAKP